MFNLIPDEIKILIILKLPCKKIKILALCNKELFNLIKNNNLIEKRKFAGFPRTEKHYLGYDFKEVIERNYLTYNRKEYLNYINKIDEYHRNFYSYLQQDHCNFLNYIDEITNKYPLLENHCAAYDIKFLAIFNTKLNEFLVNHFINLKNHAWPNGYYFFNANHCEELLIVLNEIIDDLPINLIRGDIIYERCENDFNETNRFIFDGDKIISLVFTPTQGYFPKEFAIDLDKVSINYWKYERGHDKNDDHHLIIEGIPDNPIWLDISKVKEQCLSNIKDNGNFPIEDEIFTTYTQFLSNDKIYYIILTFKANRNDFAEILDYEDKLLICPRDNNVLLLHEIYNKNPPAKIERTFLAIPRLI